LACRGFDGAPQQGDDGRVDVEETKTKLQRIGNVVSQQGREPRLIVEFDELDATHGIRPGE